MSDRTGAPDSAEIADSTWNAASEALDRAHEIGRRIQVWLRDDDCVAVTPALDRLTALCTAAGMPILLAVIPEPAEPGLAGWVAAHPAVTPCQHGVAHRNHAAPGKRACELGGARPPDAVRDELVRGRAKLKALFGAHLSDILVPPWNRIDADIVSFLPGLGFSALSTFGPTPEGDAGIRCLDSDLDIIDWRNGRIGRPLHDLSRKLAGLVDRQNAVGILTHHLAHDATAWAALEEMLGRLHAHPAVQFTKAAALLG